MSMYDELSTTDLLNLSICTREGAERAHADGRLNVAHSQFLLACRLYARLGNSARATQMQAMAQAVDAQQRAIADGEEEEGA